MIEYRKLKKGLPIFITKLPDEIVEEIKEWIYDFEPDTEAQERRWENAIAKVITQLERFAGEANSCEEECVGHSRV